MVLRGAIAFLGMISLLSSAAVAEKRVALVIGNAAYAKVGKLANPTSDADAIAALFRTAGFDVVEAKRDLGLAAMHRTLRDFSDKVHDADIAAVFFAGHGIEMNGNNFLIPVDAALERDTDVEIETVSLDRVTQMLERAKRLRLVILDACRDNPFVRSMRRTAASRSIGRGLAEVRVLTSDTLIAFAAKHGSTAADGKGTNSPYTTALVKHIATPGLDLRLALGRVRDEVLKGTANRQEPHYYGSLGGEEITLVTAIKPAQALPAPESKLPPPALPAQSQTTEAERAWLLVKDTTNPAILEEFITRYRKTFYATLARERINELKKVATATLPVPVPTTPAEWTLVPDSCCVIGVTALPNGAFVGVGRDQTLYTRQTLSSSWVPVPNSCCVTGVAAMPNGTLVGIGQEEALFTRQTLSSGWIEVPDSCCVIGVTAMPNGVIVGIGQDQVLYTRQSLSSGWVQVPDSCCVIGVTAMPNGVTVGIGQDQVLYTRQTLNSGWVPIPNSCCATSITVMREATILVTGTNRFLYTRATK